MTAPLGITPAALPATAGFGRLSSRARGTSTSDGSSHNAAPPSLSPVPCDPTRRPERVARPPAGATQSGPSIVPPPTGRSYRSGSISSAASGRCAPVADYSRTGRQSISSFFLPPDYGRCSSIKRTGRLFGTEISG